MRTTAMALMSLVFALFAFAVHSGAAISCFECDSHHDPQCGDPYKSITQSTDCDALLKQHPRLPSTSIFDRLRGLEDVNTNAKPFCLKAVLEGEMSGSSSNAHGSSGDLFNRIGGVPATDQPATTPTDEAHIPPPNQQCGGGSWKFPPTCGPGQCEYEASWNIVGGSDVHFTIRYNSPNLWSGIGFSKDGKMDQSDAIIGFIHQGRPFANDVWNVGYNPPQVDREQNIRNDIPLAGEQCPYFTFPVRGGSFNPTNKNIHKHEDIKVSDEPICVIPCPSRRVRQAPAPHNAHNKIVVRRCGYLGSKDEQCTHISQIVTQQGFKLQKCETCKGNKCNTASMIALSTILLVPAIFISRLIL
ncbi:hypothetical protein B566_EDAN007728 [Ephemera danica]|nr:hypothetical protein B566_EDAN007728 [Ephemera danica]